MANLRNPSLADKKKKNIVILIAVVLVAFAALSYGMVNVYLDMKKKDSKIAAMVIAMQSIQNGDDPSQKKLVNSLKESLEASAEEKNNLNQKVGNLTTEIDKLKKDIDAKNNQINFLTVDKARAEAALKNQINEFEQKVAKGNTDITQLNAEIEKIKSDYQALDNKFKEEISSLQNGVRTLEFEKNGLERSLDKFQKSSIAKETAKMHYNLANHFIDAQKYKLAAEEYNRALKLTPYDAEAHYNLAILYDVYLGKYPNALQHYKRCLQINPKYKKRQEIENRLISLQLEEAVKMPDSYAKEDPRQKFKPNDILVPSPAEAAGTE